MSPTWLLQCTAPYIDVMGVKSIICTSPRKWLSRTICRAVCACTLMMRLLPRFSTLQPYSCVQALRCQLPTVSGRSAVP